MATASLTLQRSSLASPMQFPLGFTVALGEQPPQADGAAEREVLVVVPAVARGEAWLGPSSATACASSMFPRGPGRPDFSARKGSHGDVMPRSVLRYSSIRLTPGRPPS